MEASPTWYQRRSAVFAVVFLVGFFGGWAASFAALGRYEPAFATVGARWGAHGPSIAAFGALALVIAALALRIWGSSYLSARTVWDEDVHAETLTIAGPFRFVRHPLYLGNVLLAVGLGAGAPFAGWIFIVLADALFIRRLIRFEDEHLAARHGEAFRTYARTVPSVVPRMKPAAANRAQQPSLVQGLSAESLTMFVVAGMVALFAIPRYGAFVLIASYLAGIVVQRRIER